MSSRCTAAALVVLSAFLSAAALAQDSSEHEQLSPGKTPGTFSFTYSGDVSFTLEPAFPVKVVLADNTHREIASYAAGADPSTFTVTADLVPGSYSIETRLLATEAPLYWNVTGHDLFIDLSGNVTIQPNPDGHSLVHLHKMTVLQPPPTPVIPTITAPHPLLTWEALRNADRYEVSWSVKDAPSHPVGPSRHVDTAEPQLAFPDDLIPDRQYQWTVNAFSGNDRHLGHSSIAYFFTPGPHAAFEQSPTSTPSPPTQGTPYFGLIPTAAPSSSHGLLVSSIIPCSPALRAGLQPGDILTSFNGQSLADISPSDFVHLIRSQPLGTQVSVEYVRDGQSHTATVTVEAAPRLSP